MKVCRICEVEKPLSEFPTKGNRPARCKKCAIKVYARYKWERRKLGIGSPRPWAFDDDAGLLVLAFIGMPTKEIACQLGRTLPATRARRQDLKRLPAYAGLRLGAGPFWTEERKADLHDLIVVKHLSRSQAAKVLKVSANVVIGAVQRYLPEACGKRQARVGI